MCAQMVEVLRMVAFPGQGVAEDKTGTEVNKGAH